MCVLTNMSVVDAGLSLLLTQGLQCLIITYNCIYRLLSLVLC